jgi:hypothetical protein
MGHHDLTHPLDFLAWGLAIVAGISLASAALFATILAGLGSFALAMVRIYYTVKRGEADSD